MIEIFKTGLLIGVAILAAALIFSLVVAAWKKISPATVPAAVASLADTAGDYADEASGAAACMTLALLAKRRANTALGTLAAQSWALVMNFPTDAHTDTPKV